MHYVSEEAVQQVVSQQDVTAAIESMYVAMSRKDAQGFPTVRESIGYADAVFGFKSGIDRGIPLLGVKAGGYWKGNHARGFANHQSTVLLFDPDSGQPGAIVRGNLLTALRTAAASAISIKYLAREDARVLGIIGAGGQAEYQVRAAFGVAAFDTVLVFDADPGNPAELIEKLSDLDAECRGVSVEQLVGESDVVITITPATEPVVPGSGVRPGTHIACMGADTRGKHEVETSILAGAGLFVDDCSQSVSIGEFQHAYDAGQIQIDDLVFIGDVIDGQSPGRTDDSQVTVFDSSGVGLQDLYAARLALKLALEKGLATSLD